MTSPTISLSLTEFSEFFQTREAINDDRVAVAVSGGADSLALAILLGEWCRGQGISLTALTVDHGLRPEAAIEAEQVGTWLKKYDIPHFILKWEGEKPHSNIQDEARLARYTLMGNWCARHKIRKLFLAHHQGDQAETFLIRLFRGSGVNGLSAMKSISDFPVSLDTGATVMLVRPLLNVTKERLEATLLDHKQNWIEDPSNQNESYTRIKVRNLLRDSDIEGLNTERMAKTAVRMGRVQSLLQSLTDELSERAVRFHPEAYAVVNLDILLAAHEEISLRLLSYLVRELSGGPYSPRLTKLEALYHNLKEADFMGQTLRGCLITPMAGNQIMISRESSAIDDVIDLKNSCVTLWDGRFLVENEGKTGRLQKLGAASWKKACQDHPDLKKLKLLKIIRDSLPCIISHDGSVLLPDFIQGFEKNGFKACFNATLK
ncbi:MAG: tRNA lysidine(34) synthetase TilS [Emcibacter sp.]|nr:tRNA lysidine(34) synthetase TilS [Emcibacter sp.]